jgi:hypothetical protein
MRIHAQPTCEHCAYVRKESGKLWCYDNGGATCKVSIQEVSAVEVHGDFSCPAFDWKNDERS